ncbi:hypothetical protein AB6E21_00185 [Photobacterium swingsii]|uniref:hypothetical protein n=1 Tax=Photobacterium swingsii TaxID=680026 RepID=UPI00354C8047
MPQKDISLRFYKSVFTSRKLLSYILWLHSGMFAASFAYFLALLSAHGNSGLSTWLKIASFFFSMALVSNMIATMVCLLGQRMPRVTAKIISNGLFFYIPMIGGGSMAIGVLFMFAHFSWLFTIMPILLTFGSIKAFSSSFSKLKPLDDYEFQELFGNES